MTTGTVLDPGRVRRALALEAEPLDGGGWRVGDWTVDPRHGCDCPDRMYRGATCKHEIAVRLAGLDPDIRAALIEVAG